MSRTASAANGGEIAMELRNWARGCHATGDDGEQQRTVAPLSAECVHKQRRALRPVGL
jgi:hypothetical protein